MKVALWAEARRLREIEGLSQREIARRLRCSRDTVQRALAQERPPDEQHRAERGSLLDPFKEQIQMLIARSPGLSAVRVTEELRKGAAGFRGSEILVRRYLRTLRPARTRVYQEVTYEPGQAMQVDWGHCGDIRIEDASRKVSVFVAVLCYSRLVYIEFTLSQRKAEFYRAIQHALEFFGGSPRRIIFDNLKAAVVNGAGRQACLHREFLALCGHYYLEPIACAARDPQSKGIVEAGVRYVKHNALQGRVAELTCWEDYQRLAVTWRDEVANVRVHVATRQRPIDRFAEERPHLRTLPSLPHDTDEIVTTMTTSHARVRFDDNRYSVPPQFVQQPVLIRANAHWVRVLHQGREIACHSRSYARGKIFCQSAHQLEALQLRRRRRANDLAEAFDALGEAARQFHLALLQRPVQTNRHLRRLMNLVHLYGRAEVVAAITQALAYQTYDAAYVETILLQERRKRELPSPTPLRPQRQELIDDIHIEPADPATYDRLFGSGDLDDNSSQETPP